MDYIKELPVDLKAGAAALFVGLLQPFKTSKKTRGKIYKFWIMVHTFMQTIV